jgi:hypothetical protein
VKTRLSLVALALISCVVTVLMFLPGRQENIPATTQQVPAGLERSRPPDEFGKPHLDVSPDGRLRRIMHPDANGLFPLEIIPSPEGEIRIQRTFSTDGRLLKEEATRNGVPIPVPAK